MKPIVRTYSAVRGGFKTAKRAERRHDQDSDRHRALGGPGDRVPLSTGSRLPMDRVAGVLDKFASIVIEPAGSIKESLPTSSRSTLYAKELPRTTAKTIRDFVVKIFPGLGGLFAEIAPEVELDKKDIQCGTDPSGAELTPERQAVLDLMERLRVERCGGDAGCAEQLLLAYARLSQEAGISEERKLTPDEIGKLGDQIRRKRTHPRSAQQVR